jgi:hypothetical protein
LRTSQHGTKKDVNALLLGTRTWIMKSIHQVNKNPHKDAPELAFIERNKEYNCIADKRHFNTHFGV